MRIAVLDDYLKVAKGMANWDALKADITFFNEFIQPDKMAETLASFDVVVAMRERSAFPASLIQALPNLKLLVTTGLRNNSIDLDACRQAGVVVSGSPGDPLSTGATAELTWSLLLALFKKIPQEDANMRKGLWQTSMPPTIKGKRLGLLGVGNLGQQVGRVGTAFGMEVVAWSPNLTAERAAEAGVKLVSKEELFKTSDAISIHLVLSDRTRQIVDAASLHLMKPTAYLVNTSRAGLVDLAALKLALEQGKIGGAGLDVYASEPVLANDPWRQVPRTVLTPHLGYATPENFAVFYKNVVANIEAFAAGTPTRVLT
ncbi:MAG: D-2-hydroxyacid dehydrogenase family protein [Burkholderiaceae bacterium]|nr:D-2-hydroxyacid dehydrogenase family protein [Burkholderiaceae bacterium]